LLIRQEKGGEVSTYLHRLPEQSTIELRGPKVEWRLPDDIQEVIFLAGGTGIAPAMQVAQMLRSKPGSKMHILWANRRREDCLGGVSDHNDNRSASGSSWKSLFGLGKASVSEKPLSTTETSEHGVIVRELEALKKRNTAHASELAVQYYVDEEKSFIKPQDVEKRLLADTPDRKGSRVILISGPDGFIEYWAGKKLWIDGRETQGPLAGALSRMDLKGWSVYKL
jgi:ferredoxin-NADP reductase